jgi:hypothetical protein
MAITKTIKQWIFKTFFKDRLRFIEQTLEEKAYWEIKYKESLDRISEMKHMSNAESVLPRPTMADLMREVLGTHVMNISHVDKQNKPPSPLDVPKALRDHRIAQLAMVYNNETFNLLCDYLVDIQGNFIAREANGDVQMTFGRGSINGIETIRSELAKAQALYEEATSPPEEYDEHAPI